MTDDENDREPSPEEIGALKRKTRRQRQARGELPDDGLLASIRQANDRIETVCLFALEMGHGRPALHEASGERYWISPYNRKPVMLDAEGHVHKARLIVGEAELPEGKGEHDQDKAI